MKISLICTILKFGQLKTIFLVFAITSMVSCTSENKNKQKSFDEDIAFVQKYQKTLVLKNKSSAILIVPAFEARVMTSTANGTGLSHGYIDYEFIAKNEITEGGNAYGGEDRLWLGPLGSKYTLFYDQNKIQGDNWYVPNAFDAEPYQQINSTDNTAHFRKEIQIINNIGTHFTITIEREIQLFTKTEIENQLHIALDEKLKSVGFQSKNTITNIGEDWLEDDGIIAPWVLGMFKGNYQSTAIFPVNTSGENPLKINKYLNDFDTTRVKNTQKTVYFKTDGAYRSKIGIPKENATNIMGNYDAENEILTIVTFNFNNDAKFLSSIEEETNELYGGDVINSYNNDLVNHKTTFFELESAASGKILQKGESNVHVHRTFHFEGNKTALNKLSKKLLGTDLEKIISRF